MAEARPRVLWLRHETKAYEERVTVTPETAAKLIDSGKFEVHVERSPTRIIADSEYEKVGCTMEDTNAWVALEKDDNLLCVGLKELAQDTFPIVNSHAYFAHAFKGQDGWKDVLGRYKAGGGVIYDYEFLCNPAGHNVGAAMSPFAGFVGAAVGIRCWCHQQLQPDAPLAPVRVSTKEELCQQLRDMVQEVKTAKGCDAPTVMVMGALGRCGKGAVECAERAGLEVVKWDKEETKAGGPFKQILTDADVFINCILLQGSMAPFLTRELVDKTPERRLTAITDVSCDPNSTNNPIPLYDHITTWAEPAKRVADSPKPLDIVSIDNLPSVLALEASHAFADTLLPALLEYPHGQGWQDAKKVFEEKLALASE